MLRRNDIIIFCSVLLAAALCFASLRLPKKSIGSTVTVSSNNKSVYHGSLYVNKKIALPGNTVIIQDGKVYVSDADCKNQLCVNHKSISKAGETIICLPNRVIAEVE